MKEIKEEQKEREKGGGGGGGGEHCWLQAAARICLTRDIKVGQSGEVWLEVEHFSLQQVAQFIPPQTQLQGEVNAKASTELGKKRYRQQIRKEEETESGSNERRGKK